MLSFRLTLSKGFAISPLETLCFAICLNAFEWLRSLSNLSCSIHRITEELTVMVYFAARLFLHLAVFFCSLTSSAVYWCGWPPLAAAVLKLALWNTSHYGIPRAMEHLTVSRLPMPTPAFSHNGPFNAFAIKDQIKITIAETVALLEGKVQLQ